MSTLADRLNGLEEYYIAQKVDEIRQMRERGLDIVSLALGSPDLPPPPEAIQAAMLSMSKPNTHGYTMGNGTPELRQALSKWVKKFYDVNVDPKNQVLPLIGSKEGIFYLSLSKLNEGDSVLIPSPGYPMYAAVANILGAKVIYYHLEEENGWLPDLEKLSKEDLSKCKLMWVNYPHMPTGATATAAFFEELIAFAKKKNIFVCNDSPYGFVLNRENPPSIIKADPDMQHCAELNSFSKSFNMAGWRLGFLLGRAEFIKTVHAIKSYADSGIYAPIQAGAIAALEVSDSWHQEKNKIYAERRAVVWKIFDHLGYTYDRNQVGMFVWAKAPDSVAEVKDHMEALLEKTQVFIMPGFFYGPTGTRYARASLCVDIAELKKALSRIEKI